MSNLAVLFTTARSNLQFGGLDDNCPGYTRLGHWPSEFKNVSGNRTACTVLDAPLDLPPGFTQVCILLATNDSSCGRSSKKRSYYHYYAEQLVISGFIISSLPTVMSFLSSRILNSDYRFETLDSSPAASQLGT